MVKEKELKELQHRIKALEEERDGLLDAGEDIHALANFQERIGPLANKQEIIDVLLESICISKDLPYASYIGALNGFYKVKSEYINDDVQGLLGREYKGEEAGLLIKASRVKKLCSRGRDVSDPIGFFPKNPERDVDYFCLIPMGPKGMAHGIVAVCTFEGDISFQHQTVPLLERLASTATSKIESLELMKTIEDLNIKLRERLGKKKIELKRSEESYRTLVEGASDAIVTIDPEGNVSSWNKAAQRMLGYEPEEVIGKPAAMLTPEELRDEQKEVVIKVKETGFVDGYETIRMATDGTKVPVEMTVSAMKDENGEVVGLSAILRDITERKKAEEALLESEERFRKIFEEGPLGMIITGLDFRFVNVNPTLSRMLGYTEQELLKLSFPDITHPDDVGQDVENAKKLMRGEIPIYRTEKRYIRKDKHVLWINLTATLIRSEDGKPQYFLTMVEDITERKRAEEALRESEEKFKTLAEKSPNMIFISKRGRVVYVNTKCEEVMGYRKEEFYSEDFNLMDIIAPESRDLIKENLKRHMKGGEIEPYEYTLLTKEGREIIGIHTTKLIDFEGETAILGIVTDITERKKAEERINALNKDLDLKVRERTAEVEEQKEELTVANEELTLMNEELVAAQDELSELNKTLEKKVEERTAQWRLSENVSTSLGRVIEESLNEIFVFDSETLQFINVNRGARENLGYTMKELKNLTPLDLKPEFTPEQFNELIKPLRTGEKEKIVFNTVHKRKDGSLYDVEVHLQHSTFGNQSAFIAVILDITDRKRAEDEIKERMEDLEILNAIISAVSSTLDPVEVFHRITQSAAELIGGDAASLAFYDEEKGVMTYPYHYNMTKKLTQVVAEKGRGLAEPVMKTRKGVIIEDYPSHPRALKEFVDAGLRVLIAVPLISKDRAFGALGVFGLKRGKRFTEHDLKLLEGVGKEVAVAIENARLYQEIKDFSKTLEKNVRERTRELEDAKNSLLNLVEDLEEVNLKLQEADRLKSVFLATMSHELRTPLNSIIGFTGILLQDMAGELNPEQKKQLNMVYSSAKQLLSLINDLLDVSRIEAGKIEVSPEEFALKDFVDEVTLSFTRAIEEKGIVLSKEVEDAVLNTDRRRAGQVLMNLLENAVKFTKKGSIKVTAKRVDGRVIFSVEDTGIGIRKTDWTKVFEPFQQIELPKGIKKDGTGIGLYLSRKIAHCLGGDLSFESRYGKGSIFTFTIPRVYQKN